VLTSDPHPTRRPGRRALWRGAARLASDETQAAQAALGTSRWAVTGWKVMSELPNPANFDAGTSWVDEDDIRRLFAVGPDAGAHVQAVQSYVDAGFDRLVLLNVGPDPDGFIDFFERDPAGRVRSLTPRGD
jgi:hypothetical protein